MSVAYAELPLWAAILSAAFILLGSSLTLIGAIGLVRLGTFYKRIHAPTLGSSWGTAGIVMGSMIFFTAASSRLVIHEILIGIFVTVTMPVTLMMLGRAAIYRDRSEGNLSIPPSISGPQPEEHLSQPDDGLDP